jgi:hypothetical protein
MRTGGIKAMMQPPQKGVIHAKEHQEHEIAKPHQEVDNGQDAHVVPDVRCQRADAADNRGSRVQTQARGPGQRDRSADHEEEDEQSHPELDQQVQRGRDQSLCNRPHFALELGNRDERRRPRYLGRQLLGRSCRGVG